MITELFVHCSATRPSQDISADEIRRWHVDGNGWSDIGYHWVIRRNGVIEKGRPETKAGAHVFGRNNGSIGVCLVGGINDAGEPDANYTRAQWASLGALVDEIQERHGPLKVLGHRDADDGKACPCFDVVAWVSELAAC